MKTEKIELYVEKKLKDKIITRADYVGLSLSSYIRFLVKKDLEGLK
jgi:hypothetical protein